MKYCLALFLFFTSQYSFSQEVVNYRVRNKAIFITEYTSGKILAKVPRNKILTFVSFNDSCNCFYVKYKKYTGIVTSEQWLNDYSDDNSNPEAKEVLLTGFKERLSMANAAAKSKRKSDLIRKYGYIEGTQVSEGKIWIGMTVDMTLDSRGIPFKVNRTSSDWGPREQWIYSDTYLYFENGILAEILIIKRDNTTQRASP